MIFQTRSKIRELLELQIYYNRILTMDFTKIQIYQLRKYLKTKHQAMNYLLLKYPIVRPKKHLQIMLFLILLQIL